MFPGLYSPWTWSVDVSKLTKHLTMQGSRYFTLSSSYLGSSTALHWGALGRTLEPRQLLNPWKTVAGSAAPAALPPCVLYEMKENEPLKRVTGASKLVSR
jgi:hypothetical protein